MVTAGTRLFFSGEGSVTGLWVTDGTTAGLRRIGSIQFHCGRESYCESRPASLGGELFFAGSDSASSLDSILWKSDGTEAGTVPVLDRDGQRVSSPRSFQIFGGRVVFASSGGLWQTDGTAAGTFEIQHVAAPGEGLGPSWNLEPAASRLFYRGYDRDHGTELWALEP
jgi:ELWxxDGT repeat protein